MMDVTVSVSDLVKVFPRSRVSGLRSRRRQVLDGVSFSARRGEILGLLGENGAGKTTLLKIIATLILPTSGKINVMGHDAVREDGVVRGFISFTTNSERSFYYRLDGWQNLRFFCGLYGMDMKSVRRNVENYLDALSMRRAMGMSYMHMSTGMRRKLSLLRTLALDRPIVLLDEPSSNMDPHSIEEVNGIISRLKEEGDRTILLSTNSLGDAEQLCDRLIVLSGGRVAYDGIAPQKDLRHGAVEIVIPSGVPVSISRLLPGAGNFSSVDGTHLCFNSDNAVDDLNSAIDRLRKDGIPILSARITQPISNIMKSSTVRVGNVIA